MAFIPAKCSQCGAEINVDNTLEYGYCSHCGTKYITEKIIKNESIYIENQTNINLNFADERKQCELLFIFYFLFFSF